METKELLEKQFVIVEGTVKEVSPRGLWVTRADNGRDVSFFTNDDIDISESFLPGHTVRCVATELSKSPQLIKAYNLSTDYTVSAVDARNEKILGVTLSGIGGVMAPNPLVGTVMFVPFVCWLIGIFYLWAILIMVGKVRNGGAHFMKGILAFVLSLIVFPIAPTVGVVVAFGNIMRQLMLDQNEVHDRADALLASAAKTAAAA